MSLEKISIAVNRATELKPDGSRPVVTGSEMKEAIEAGGSLMERDEYRVLDQLSKRAKAGDVVLLSDAQEMLDEVLAKGTASRYDTFSAKFARFFQKNKMTAAFATLSAGAAAGAGTGAAIGAGIGFLAGGVGAAPGAGIGAGIGGLVGFFGGFFASVDELGVQALEAYRDSID